MKVSPKTLSRNLDKVCRQHTPYGSLITSLDLPLNGGGSYSWKICNPFALLYLLLSQSSAFEALAREHLRGTKAKISLYADEASAGNVLHPKLPRKSQCVYWSISSFPTWFHSRAYAWLLFGYLRPKSWAAFGVRPRLLSLSLSLSLFPSSYQPCNANVASPFKILVHMQHVSRRLSQKKMTLLCFGAERIKSAAVTLLGALVQHTEKYRWRHVGCVQTHTPVFLQC